MSRKIKYRAWLKAEKIMVTVEEINFYDDTFAYIFDNYVEVEQEWIEEDIKNVELLQYTGLEDKMALKFVKAMCFLTNTMKNLVKLFSVKENSFMKSRQFRQIYLK